MIEINYNVDEAGWKRNFPCFKNCITKTVNETIKIVDSKIHQNLSVTFFLTSNKKIKELNLSIETKINPLMYYLFQC